MCFYRTRCNPSLHVWTDPSAHAGDGKLSPLLQEAKGIFCLGLVPTCACVSSNEILCVRDPGRLDGKARDSRSEACCHLSSPTEHGELCTRYLLVLVPKARVQQSTGREPSASDVLVLYEYGTRIAQLPGTGTVPEQVP